MLCVGNFILFICIHDIFFVTRCMFISSGLPKIFWAEAVVTVAYLVNRCPSSVTEFKTLEGKWSNKALDLFDLRVFGCSAYAHQNEGKSKPKAIKCVFLEYSKGTKGYRLWIKRSKGFRKINNRDIVFNENDFLWLTDTNNAAEKDISISNSTDITQSIIQVEP